MPTVSDLLEEAARLSDAEKVELVGAILSGQGTLWLARALGALEEKLGVQAGSASAPPGPREATGPKAEMPVTSDVVLKSAGANKINAIKAVRELTDLGLKEAKDLVEKGGKSVKKAVSREEAEAAAGTLKDAGAEVEIRPAV